MDHYATLGIPRRLVVGEEELREAYETRRRAVHPDAGGEAEAFRNVQESFAVLQRPGRRLRHWLELETGGFEARGEAPGVVMDVFPDVGAMLARLGETRRKKTEARSALARSMAEREGVAALAGIEALQERLQGIREGFISRFVEFEAAGAEQCGTEAAAAARGLAFIEKWDGELREAAFALVGGG
ncbi:MAG: DnaJ domain-containing protein [Akkermansiaceae bacterium]|nr:DnaJ domain-containing protein [Akkermansiaceae bacterium]